MAVETFQTLIARNKRNTLVLIILFLAFFAAVGLAIGAVWGNGDRTFSIGLAVAAAGIAFVLTLGSFYGGSSVLLAGSGAREITKADDPQLFDVVEELSLAGGTPMPRIFLIDEPAMNAFATGRDPAHAAVAITAGLRQKLTREELQGVLGHEMSHVRHYDVRYAMMIAVLVGTLVILCDIFLRSLWWGSARRRSDRDRGGGMQIVLLLIALVLAILAPILAKIIQMAISRQREFLADAGSVELTRDPQGLASALAKLGGDQEVLHAANRATAPLYIVHPMQKFDDDAEERSASIFDTHPPIRERIERLLSMER